MVIVGVFESVVIMSDEALVLQKIWATLKDVGRLDERQAEDSRRVLEAGGQMNANMLQVCQALVCHGLAVGLAVDGFGGDRWCA
jgi:hypothetical protein